MEIPSPTPWITADHQALLEWVRPGGRLPGGERRGDGAWWDGLLQMATPLLHPWLLHRLEARGPAAAAPPAGIRERLQAARRANALLHLRRTAELRRIHEAFHRRGIRALILKGLPLACLVYPDPSLRPMIDIDLAVAAESWPAAREALLELGLRVPGRHAHRPSEGPHAIRETAKPFQRPGSRIMVDLHAGLDLGSAGRARGTQELEALSRPVELAGATWRTLAWKPCLIHLCSHLSERHLFDRGLLSLLDLTLALDTAGARVDWEAERAAWAADPASARYMTLPMTLAGRLLGAPVDRLFGKIAAADPEMTELQALAAEQILGAGHNRVSPGLVELASRSPWERLAHLVRRLNPWRRSEMGDGGTGAARAGALALRRLASDLAARTRIYAAALRRGDLTRENLGRAMKLQEGRERLAALMGVEAPGVPAAPSPRRPGAGGD